MYLVIKDAKHATTIILSSVYLVTLNQIFPTLMVILAKTLVNLDFSLIIRLPNVKNVRAPANHAP